MDRLKACPTDVWRVKKLLAFELLTQRGFISDGFVKSRKTPFFVIPAPHQVRDKLKPVKDSDLSENPGFSIGYRVPGLLPDSIRDLPERQLFTVVSSLIEPKIVETEKVLNGLIRALRDD